MGIFSISSEEAHGLITTFRRVNRSRYEAIWRVQNSAAASVTYLEVQSENKSFRRDFGLDYARVMVDLLEP
jgi:hypothetical protein